MSSYDSSIISTLVAMGWFDGKGGAAANGGLLPLFVELPLLFGGIWVLVWLFGRLTTGRPPSPK